MLGMKFKIAEEKHKIAIITISLAAVCFITYYFHQVLKIGTVFTHFFYIPIVLAFLWWKRKGLFVAGFLSMLLIFSHCFLREYVTTVNDYFRALMFMVIAIVVSILSERIAKAEQRLKASNQQLRASEQQLKAFNQQLRVSEQQLKASNQQLRAGEQQLKDSNRQLREGKAFNRQLRASEQQLKAANQQLRAGEQQLKAANQQLKAKEQGIRKLEESWRESFNSLEDVMLIIDKNYNIENINAHGLALLGKSKAQVVGKKCYQIIHQTKSPGKNCPFKQTLKTEKISSVEQYEPLFNKHFSIKSSPVFDENGKITRFVDLMRDITGYKEKEKMLQRYSKTQAVLLREVNHRVKNNLTAIISLLHKEEDRAQAKGALSCLPMVRSLAGRIHGLSVVHSLLSEGGWRPLILSQLCEKVIRATLKSFFPSKTIDLIIAASPVEVDSDQAHHLTLVLNELVTNSLKHAFYDRDTGRIKVDIERKEKNVLIHYRDNGLGFPREMLRGDFSKAGVGFDLIRGIAAQSLKGEVRFSNGKGGVVTILFKTGIEPDDKGVV